MSNDNYDNLDPELDALLETARWPDPSPQATQRLRERWHELSGRRSGRMLRIGLPLAAAAAVAVAFGGTWFILTQGGQVPPDVAQAPIVLRPPTVSSPGPTPPPKTPPPRQQQPRIVAQAPTPRERLAVLSASPSIDLTATVRTAIDLARDGDLTTAKASLRPLRASVVERELAMTFASTTDGTRRRAAIRLLSDVGGTSTLPLLARVAKDPQFAADAMPGVARLGGVPALVALARTAQSVPRREAMAHLLTLDPEPAVSEFLVMVLDPAMRADALASLRSSSAPPVEQLIARLDDPHVDRRFAAAKALGTLCHRADVGAALRRMVGQNHHRREALAALLSCPGGEAATFIKTARTRASIDAEVRVVQNELRRMF